MHTSFGQHRTAVLTSIALVDTVRPEDLAAPTPCAGWDLADLLAHMTVQHRGFAAAARGSGADRNQWRPETVIDAVRFDPARTYGEAARDVLHAFAADGADETPFALAEFGPGALFPAEIAMGFHFVDYVVHGWDVAESLDRHFDLPTDVVAAVLPLAMAVPDGDFRAGAGAPFGPAVADADADDTPGDLDRILRYLGRRTDWRHPGTDAAVASAPWSIPPA